MIETCGTRIHADISGEGRPPVVFEAGIAATSLSWRLVQPEIARTAQTVSYDRAGLGWSGKPSNSRIVWALIDELRAMLDHAGVPAPRVLVAHSFGGLIALGYAKRFPAEVAGLVLVDPITRGDVHLGMLRRGIFLARLGELLARFGVVRMALALVAGGSQRVPRLIARASSGRRGAAFTERMAGEIRKLPREIWPAIQSHWCDPKCFRAMRNHLEALPQSAQSVFDEAVSLDVPLIVLSAVNATPAKRAEHERIARSSSRGRLEIVEESGHWIMLDRPDVVIREIANMVANG